jgi:FAD/FMN-containing dehydrogenase
MKEEIQKFFKGEVSNDRETLLAYSKDASLFKVTPTLVTYPKDSEDLKTLVKYVNRKKKSNPNLSLTVRAAGSCMSGGSLTESIVADVTRHMNRIGKIESDGVWVEPGVFYRNFEPLTLAKGLILPCYTASKNLCALGGMFGNNSAGEKTLRYGKMENFILETKVILSDGNEYTLKPLSWDELEKKKTQKNFGAEVHRRLFELIDANKTPISDARPRVSKNSAGYYLWNVCQEFVDTFEKKGMFDVNKLLVGSQGTLGIVTDMKLRLVPVEKVSKLFVIFLKDLEPLAKLINEILPTNPESVESYDDDTLKLAFRFFPEMLKSMKVKNFLKLMLSFIPESLMILERGLPELVVLVEYAGQTEAEVDKKLEELEKRIAKFDVLTRKTRSEEEASKYWTIRRESFNLLRKHIHGSRTAPFVDDVVVKPEHMPEFLPKMRKILDSYKLNYTIAGHAGNGNFHIIPLMNMKRKTNVFVIEEVSEKVYELVKEYKGSITGEHNDGIVRTPYLNKMYSPEILELFKKTKEIFDPQNIFNPGKKVPLAGKGQPGTKDYLSSHIAIE